MTVGELMRIQMGISEAHTSKGAVDGEGPAWALLRDNYILTNPKLKDWDKMPMTLEGWLEIVTMTIDVVELHKRLCADCFLSILFVNMTCYPCCYCTRGILFSIFINVINECSMIRLAKISCFSCLLCAKFSFTFIRFWRSNSQKQRIYTCSLRAKRNVYSRRLQ
ncbi:uncharacterized protein LOC126595335 [Malus sylvestris]|uniref:uncharacterized protein LOC126595335 n=1 Tax=Malus sylvestris TaxID=3752 RepID=UPI0021ACA324|nr:uncharacterized protein LOC126595335 [Malus sylvestris]